MGQALTIKAGHEQGYAIVTAAGEINISTVTRLPERLFELAASGCSLMVDLDQASFIDSVGLAALVGTAKRAAARRGSPHAACDRPKIRELFRLNGLECRIPLARTLEALVAAQTTPG